jgi:hypothetical protein
MIAAGRRREIAVIALGRLGHRSPDICPRLQRHGAGIYTVTERVDLGESPSLG